MGKASHAKGTVAARVQLNFLNETTDGKEEFGEFTVNERIAGGERTYEFGELRVGDTVYKHVTQPRSDPALFDQWIYLLCPEEFSAAMAQTAWARLQYIRQSRVVLRDDEGGGRLVWRLVVNYPVTIASWTGHRMHRREFMLHFTVDGGGKEHRKEPRMDQSRDEPGAARPAPSASGKKRRHRGGAGKSTA